ncbi:SusC/RagA family TonB-linked outer membrane protein [Chitinophagaceae bacterium 26-R-25]|nr:SusC/RagA family TonB-linked outer membrane protein [Chitinophagaceae bacterium 26-R-25]
MQASSPAENFTFLILFFCVQGHSWGFSHSLLITTSSETASELLSPPGVINGKVTDEKGKPLSNATVMAKGSKHGATTNELGEFSLTVKDGSVVLVVSTIGYETKEVKVNGQDHIKIVLAQTATQQQEIVIVGLQRQKKRDVVSAISSISAAQIENNPVASVDQLLQGRVSGMNVQINSGEPGVAPTIVVRGNSTVNTGIGDKAVADAQSLSTPLYVIDGMPINTSDISTIGSSGTNYIAGININDIESVDVQKDAVAKAAWGSRGANGVIYIRTKKGKSGTPEFKLNVYGGVVAKPELLRTFTGKEERDQKMNIINQYDPTSMKLGLVSQLLTDPFNPSYNNATDWQNLFYRTAAIKNVDGSFSGNSDMVNYRFGVNYYDEQGVIKSFGYTRYGFRGNFNLKINDRLNTQILLSATRGDRKRGMKYNNSDDNTPVSGANMPTSFYKLNALDSSLYLGTASNLRNKNLTDEYSASLTLNYDILHSLRYVLQGSVNATNDSRDYFQPSSKSDISDARAAGKDNYAESNKGVYNSFFLSNSLNWAKTFKSSRFEHNVVVTGSQQFSRDVATSTNVHGYRTPNDNIQTVTGIAQTDISGYSTYAASAILSYLGQVQYDLNRKYLVNLSYRADASSRFGSDSKWGYFPAAGLGWIVSDEKFFGGLTRAVSFLKLRGSIGKSGRNSDKFYAPYNSYVTDQSYNGNTTIRPDYSNGLTKNNLTWSTNIDKNVGLDAFFLNNKVTLSVDVYDRLTKGDFYDFNLPFYVGYDQINFNANDLWVSNKGMDLTIGANRIKIAKDLRWGTNLVLSYNKNRIAKLPNDNRTFAVTDYAGVSRIYAVGQPIYEMYMLKYQGVYNHESDIPFNPITGKKITYFKGNHTVKAGDPIWQDVNQDYDVWSGEDNGDQYGDRLPVGDPNPAITGGWTNDFSYKNFTLSVLCVFSGKRSVYNTFFQQQVANVVGGYNSSMKTFATTRTPDMTNINYWTPQKANAKPDYKADFPSINPFEGGYYQYTPMSNQFVEDGSYFKIAAVTLGYQLPNNLLRRLTLKNARLYMMANNLATFSRSSMPNPELVSGIGVYSGGQYPTPIKFTFGVDVTF